MTDSIAPPERLEDVFPVGEGPWVMVNLLRFRPGGGSKAYGKYATAFAKLLEEAGGRFLYRGRVGAAIIGGSEQWHAVALVEYPSREAFIRLIESDAYQAIHPHREDGLEATRLLATQAYPTS
ncbi:MAG: DUF1330 domain-containing protein [Myxococcota bacterium]